MIKKTARGTESLKPEKFHRQTTSLLVSGLAINILSLALPVMTLQIYDRILPNPGSGTLPVLISGVCLAVALEAALRLARAYILGWSGAAYEHFLSCNAIHHILQSDLSRIGPFGIGENLHRMTAIGKLRDFYNGYSLTTLFDLTFVPVFLGVIIFIAGPLAFVPAVILMLFTITSLAQGQKLRAALKNRDETDDARYNFLIESLEGIHTIKSFTLENIFTRRYESLEEKSTLANYQVTEATSSTFNTGAIFSHFMVASVISCGALFALYGHITTGALIATILLSGRMMQPIQRALALWAKYQDYNIARSKVETLFQTPLHTPIPVNGTQPVRSGLLELEKISFRSTDEKTWLLKDVNLQVKRGETVLLSGRQSAGKTALFELIAGILMPTEGTIRIDGQNTMSYDPKELIGHVGYIATEGFIFRGTIRDNLTCFGQIEEDKVREIAALLKVDRDIAKLPSGFNTLLHGNHTDNIPPGLKQRIAIVRVLAPKPRIILFDNADRGLDREGYNLVYSMFARLKGKTAMLIISDDHNMQALADRRYTLENAALSYKNGHHNPAVQITPYKELQI